MVNNNWSYRFPIYLTLLAVILTSSFSIGDLRLFDQKRILQALLLVSSSIFFLYLLFNFQINGINKPIKVWLGILFLFILASAINAALPVWSFLQVGWYLLLIELFLISSFQYENHKDVFIQAIVLGVIALCVVYTSRVYADYAIGLVRDEWTTWPQQLNIRYYYKGEDITPNGFLGFGHVRFFNHLQTWTLPILVFGYLYFRERIIPGLQYLLLFFLSSWWMLVFAADARGTMLASITSILLIIMLFKKRTIEFLKIYGCTAFVGLLLYLFLFLLPSEESREILSRFGDSGRIEVWSYSLELIADHPWLGVGPMHFSYLGNDPPWSTPHNFILQSASEWGLPAILIFISIVIYAYFKFIKQSLIVAQKQEVAIALNWRIALITSITAALAHSMFSGIFNSQLSQLLGVIILAATIGDYFLFSNKKLFKKRKKISWSVYLLIILLFINTSFVTYKVISDIPHLSERQTEYMEKYRSLTLYPRFWNQGMIYEKDIDIRDEEEGKNKEGQNE